MVRRRRPAVARMANDFVAGVVRQHPDRFFGLCVLPLQDMTRVAGRARPLRRPPGDEGHPALHQPRRPVPRRARVPAAVRRAVELDVPVLLHPAKPVTTPWSRRYEMISGLGNMFDDTIALTRIIMSGCSTSYPRLKLVCPHLGRDVAVYRRPDRPPDAGPQARAEHLDEGAERVPATGRLPRHRLAAAAGDALGVRLRAAPTACSSPAIIPGSIPA